MATEVPVVATFSGNALAKLHEACALTGGDMDTALTSALVLYITTGDGAEWSVRRDGATGTYHAHPLIPTTS